MSRAVEVGIIGAGIHGASAALALAKRGIKAAVFEQGAPASGPTGRSSAICRAYYTNRYLARVAKRSLDMLRAFGELTDGRNCGFHVTGAVYLHPASDEKALVYAAAYMNSIGTRIEVLNTSRLRSDFPIFDLTGIGIAGWEPDAGYADPVATTAGLLAKAAELGTAVNLYSRVTALKQRPGGGATVVLVTGDSIECERVLIAAGPWTNPLVAQLSHRMRLARCASRTPTSLAGTTASPRVRTSIASVR